MYIYAQKYLTRTCVQGFGAAIRSVHLCIYACMYIHTHVAFSIAVIGYEEARTVPAFGLPYVYKYVRM